ncbi:MAG TPA: LptA/OstA family protein [Verrucomicrobiae bacterium]|nr:LptA/OstA family protein [Verrucomicrobiae bacterium]
MKNWHVRIACLIALLTLANTGMLCAQTNTNAVVATATNAAVKASLPAAANIAMGVSAPAATNAQPGSLPPTTQTLISADRGEFDMAGREVTYHSHVRVDDPEMKLTSEWLITDLPHPGEHVNHIVAETNVVIDFLDDRSQTNHATCDKTVYSYEVKDGITNESVTLSGHAKVANADFVMTGEPIVLNLTTRKINTENVMMTPRQSLIKPNAGTNSPPAERSLTLTNTNNLTKSKE